MGLLEKITAKDNGYELATIGIGFDLTGDQPTEFIAELDKYYGDLGPQTFEDAVKTLMKWLADNHHPHMKVIVDSTCAELVEGQKTYTEPAKD